MQLHTLKIEEKYYIDVQNETKTFELRKNDRDFQVGDFITFKVIKNGMEIPVPDVFKITYVLKDVEKFGLDKDYCILSIKKMKEDND